MGRMAHVPSRSADDKKVKDLIRHRTNVVCPSCSMEASLSDRRLLQPIDVDRTDSRRCRNCQAVLDLSSSEPRIEAALA